MSRRLIAVLASVLVLLCGCGNDNSFKIEYVGTGNVLSTDLFLHGEINGETRDIGLTEAFKGCTVKDITFPDPDNVAMEGTEDGKISFIGGIIATIEDENGSTTDVLIKEESVFEAEKTGDSFVLLLPQE